MNRRLFRSLCMVALVASVAVRFQMNQTREAIATQFNIGHAITDVLREEGLVLLENPVKPPRVLSSAIYFQRPECHNPSVVLPYSMNSEIFPLLGRLIAPGFVRQFLYLDKSWDGEHRVSTFIEWGKHALLDVFGASRYIPAKIAIVLADPPDCYPAVAIDWRRVWDKDRHRNAAT
jgi:hypothetical protein